MAALPATSPASSPASERLHDGLLFANCLRPAPLPEPARLLPNPSAGGGANADTDMVRLPGGAFRMGSDDAEGFPADREGPVRTVEVAPFLIDRYAVSNDDFARFVAATDYTTEAERFGWSYVFAGFLPPRCGACPRDRP